MRKSVKTMRKSVKTMRNSQNTDPIHNHCIYREVSRQTARGKNILDFLFIWKILRILSFLEEHALGQILPDMSCHQCSGHPDICEEEGGRCKVSPLCIIAPIHIQIQIQI